MDGIEAVGLSQENHHPIATEQPTQAQVMTPAIDEESIDPRDIHATDRTFGSAVRTVLAMLVLSVAIGRQFTTATTVVSAVFIAFALALLIFSGIRHHLNLGSIRRGILRVDGITPLFFFALGLVANIGALVYTVQRVAEANDIAK